MAYTAGLMLLLSCMFLLVLTSLATEPMGFNCAGPSGIEYTKNSSKYLANLDLLLSSLSAKAAADTRFDNATFGNGSDKVYGLFLCRGDITPQSCQNCTKYAGNEFKVYCANKASAIVWYDNCMIRYSDQNIFSNLQQQPAFYPVGPISITLDQYNQTVVGLMSQLVKQAVSGSSTPKYYATGKQNYYTESDKVYGLVQCTPDITKDECYGCLNLSVSDISNKLYPKQGGRVLKPSCNLRYELNSYFYQQQASSSPATPLPTNPSSSATPPSTNSSVTDGKGSNSTLIVIAVIVIVVIIITIIIISILYLRFRKRKQKVKVEEVDENEITVAESLQFNFDRIRAATDNFSDANKLGQGGFGAVYKGELLDGQIVAVKRLSRNSVQGDIEFKNEVILVTKLQHRNLVRLLGFCLKGEEKLLIYEFVSNASLDHFIFDPNNHSQLNWKVRYKIIEGIARGLLYLHEDSRLKIIHRDLKASNILLDEEMNPKIADFGMARLFGMNQTQANTSRIVGTFGYMAPEYIMEGNFSVKTDVFSFGVLLLEIVSGQRNKNLSISGRSEDLLSYAWRKWKDGSALELMYPTLRENYPRSEVIKCIHIGLLCVQENMSDRPTMASVVLMLSSYSTTTLPLPTSPAFFMHSEIDFGEPSTDNNSRVTTTSGQSTSNSTTKSANEMSITELSAR